MSINTTISNKHIIKGLYDAVVSTPAYPKIPIMLNTIISVIITNKYCLFGTII